MPFNTDEIIKVSRELQQAQERVRALETRLQGLVLSGPVPIGPNGETSTQLGNLLSDDKHLANLSTAERIVMFLESEPRKDFTFREVYGFIQGKENYIRALLAKLTKEKLIASRGWGLYGSKA